MEKKGLAPKFNQDQQLREVFSLSYILSIGAFLLSAVKNKTRGKKGFSGDTTCAAETRGKRAFPDLELALGRYTEEKIEDSAVLPRCETRASCCCSDRAARLLTALVSIDRTGFDHFAACALAVTARRQPLLGPGRCACGAQPLPRSRALEVQHLWTGLWTAN